MTDDIGRADQAHPPNPFPAGAVAVLGELSSIHSTVRTASVVAARAAVDDYLTRDHPAPGLTDTTTGPGGSGEIIMVSGETGTGKTHLINEIIHRIEHPSVRARPVSTRVSLSAHGPSFRQTYREAFIRRFDYDDIVRLVVDVYAIVVAEYLGGAGGTADLAERLRKGATDPRDVVQRLGQQKLFLSRLEDRLPEIVGDDEFGRVLPLLIHPRLGMAAWGWLQGDASPTAALKERGITEPLGESGALRAMGVFAVLHGWLGRRFALLIDDLERVLGGGQAPAQDTLRPFRALLDTYITSGGLLVLSALPEFFEALPSDVPQRIRTQIVPAPMTTAETTDYIMLRRRQHDGPTLSFDDNAIKEIQRLTGGAPRRVLRLCYHAYQLAALRSIPVDAFCVHQAARRRADAAGDPVAEVRAHIERVLSAKGWTFSANHPLPLAAARPDQAGQPGEAQQVEQVDYWVPIPTNQEQSGCAILITDAVLQADDVGPLRDRCRRLRDPWQNRRALVVVAEYLAHDLRRELAEAGGIDPVAFHPAEFPDALNGRLESIFTQVSGGPAAVAARGGGDLDLSAFRDQLDRVHRQVSQTQDSTVDVAVRLEQFLRESERQWRQVRESMRHDRPAADRGTGEAELSPELTRLFRGAEGSLGAVDTVTELLDEAFDVTQSRGPAGQQLIYRLRRNNAFEAIGVALTLRGLLSAFERSIASWLEQQRGREPTDADRARLELVCDTYEAIYQTVPLSSLERLSDLESYGGPGFASTREDKRMARPQAIFRSIDGLSGLVRSAAWNVVAPSERS
jgi:hypothetical protein